MLFSGFILWFVVGILFWLDKSDQIFEAGLDMCDLGGNRDNGVICVDRGSWLEHLLLFGSRCSGGRCSTLWCNAKIFVDLVGIAGQDPWALFGVVLVLVLVMKRPVAADEIALTRIGASSVTDLGSEHAGIANVTSDSFQCGHLCAGKMIFA